MGQPTTLKDHAARRDAISRHDSSILVEAGAGSGKTAVIAGRVAMMLAEGIEPNHIAAVTFTELAASELLERVRSFVKQLIEEHIPPELRVAFPGGLSEAHHANLAKAQASIDEITCSTIHGFCQRLIGPYPAEANIDPGATVMDRALSNLTFEEIVDDWLREQLSGEYGGILVEMVLHDPKATLSLVQQISDARRARRNLNSPTIPALGSRIEEFRRRVDKFLEFVKTAAAYEAETVDISAGFEAMKGAINAIEDLYSTAGIVQALLVPADPVLCTKSGGFKSYRHKGKWEAAAKVAGLSKADGHQLNISATDHYTNCCDSWTALKQAIASQALSFIMEETLPILERFQERKRATAQLDFDDLIYAARDLLRDHSSVRVALGRRFQHVLVDEFQDTDPLQTEIFWRLCGDPETDGDDWTEFVIRPGSLFLVGDPKQAIYRFRGADVGAYVQAREVFANKHEESLLSISTNFRSCSSILRYVNERFEAILSADGQPGFTALDAYHNDPNFSACVAALDVVAMDENGKASSEQQRDAEAESVAETCARLIGSLPILGRESAESKYCEPGDIALLAPTGTELWRYEEALERRGIPVATQAGKGLYRRQEIQDLIAITRVLADRRDTLALGALLRGPLVGLTEEELLDIVWALPRDPENPERLPRLSLSTEVEHISHQHAHSVLKKIQALSRRSNSTTPHELLCQAIDVLRVRPILNERHRGQAERALANVDLYLSMSKAYAIRGMRAFSEAMTAAWDDETRAVEGRPDAQEEAVSLFTMHAAKGLEWPVVVPINTMTGVKTPESAITDRATETFFCPVFGVTPDRYQETRQEELLELERERIRLWYVAATRARQLLILPRLDVKPARSAWISLMDFGLDKLPNLDVSEMPLWEGQPVSHEENLQTRESFSAQADNIVEAHHQITWLVPSRSEAVSDPVLAEEQPNIWSGEITVQSPGIFDSTQIQGSRERGLILHKLVEEVLTGETIDEKSALTKRASELIDQIGLVPVDNPTDGLSPEELASCVRNTLRLDEIAPLRAELLAEYPVYAVDTGDGGEAATFGIVDALTLTSDGKPAIVVDWKSDVSPDAATIEHYKSQMRAYLNITKAEAGLIVLMTSGTVLRVEL
jgi:ATP-dependent exoDNAse (exonuclease V) beta subunit